MKKVLGRIANKVLIGENQFLYLRELDETILKFKEVLDYQAYIADENLLRVEIQSDNPSISMKNDIEQSVQTLLYQKLGYEMKLDVITNPDSNPEKITNSMVKRKIGDFRGAGI